MHAQSGFVHRSAADAFCARPANLGFSPSKGESTMLEHQILLAEEDAEHSAQMQSMSAGCTIPSSYIRAA